MSYEIIIIEKKIADVPHGKNWAVIRERLVTAEEMKKAFDDRYYDKKEFREWLEDKDFKIEERGYTPEITKKEAVETEILRQNVEELDLKAVIKAINGL